MPTIKVTLTKEQRRKFKKAQRQRKIQMFFHLVEIKTKWLIRSLLEGKLRP